MLANFAQTYTTYTTTTTSSTSDFNFAFFSTVLLIALLLSVFMIVCLWRIFTKAGRPGWAAIVPIYNAWVLFEIVGYPGWWALLEFIPLVNIFPAIMMWVSYYKLGKLFGKSDVFSILLIFFPFILLPVLAFGSAQYKGGVSGPAAPTTGPVAPAQPQSPVASAPVAPAPVVPAAPAPGPADNQQPPQTPPVGPVSS